MMIIKTSERQSYDKRYWARLINSLSGPKSANLVGTVSNKGVANLSIVSSVFHMGANPPLIGFIIRPHSQDSPRHTLENILGNQTFTINQVHSKIFEKAHQTSARYEREQSEFEHCGFESVYKEGFKSPFVAESKVQIGLNLVEKIDIKHNRTHMIIGEIQYIFIEEAALREDGSLDLKVVDAVAVTGLDDYNELSSLARLAYAKVGNEPKEL